MAVRMTSSHRRALCAWIVAVAATAGAGPGPTRLVAHAQVRPNSKGQVPITIAASAEANPDANGRPSPVVVRVYQLKSDTAFSRADFLVLFDDDEKALGPDLIVRDEYVLGPAESRTVYVNISEDARTVGAVAMFRDVRNSLWRASLPAPIRGLTISVERARLVLFPD
jgi:type VI secretion system protein VasD